MLVAALEQTRLQADDILRNIRSGVVTVDADGRLLYANPTAEQLLGIDLDRPNRRAGARVDRRRSRPSSATAHQARR